MNESPLPTLQEIDELLEFLPRLYAEDYEPVVSWHSGNADENGVLSIPYPEYDHTTWEFFKLLSKGCWSDFAYKPSLVGKIIRDPEYIKACSLSQIKSLLTYCNRGERFMDGHWELMIKEGYILQILQRLADLRLTLI